MYRSVFFKTEFMGEPASLQGLDASRKRVNCMGCKRQTIGICPVAIARFTSLLSSPFNPALKIAGIVRHFHVIILQHKRRGEDEVRS